MVGVRVGGGSSLPMGGAPLSVVGVWLWWAGCRCPWGGFSRCPCVLVMCGDVEKVIVNVAHRMGVPRQCFVCVIVAFGRLSFIGGRSSLFVEGASLWWVGGCCAWGCQRRPSALWAGVCGVVEKAIVDVAHPDGCGMSAAWWWALLSSLIVPRLLGIRH